jgi:myo-inositol-1(or 4)-monophosphatase
LQKSQSPTIKIIEAVALKASKIQLDYFLKFDKLKPEEKSYQDYVTIADKESEEMIIQGLQKAFPDYGFIGEESGIINPEAKKKFIIDPLDGTINFMKGLPFFCISIALADFNERSELEDIDQIEAALIYAPFFKELFYAEKGQGAFFGAQLIKHNPAVNKIICSVGNKNFNHNLLREDLRQTVQSIAHRRFFGAAALELAYVAIQKIDSFMHCSLNAWDMAAAALILKEAGAKVEDLDGGSKVFKTRNIIAY